MIISSILKYPSLDMKTTFRHILLSLAIFDTIFSLLATLTFSLPWLSEYWKLWMMPLLLPYTIPGLAQFLTLTSYLSQLTLGLQMALNGSIWTTVCVALERYLSIGHPSQRWYSLIYWSFIQSPMLTECLTRAPYLSFLFAFSP